MSRETEKVVSDKRVNQILITLGSKFCESKVLFFLNYYGPDLYRQPLVFVVVLCVPYLDVPYVYLTEVGVPM